MTSPCVASDECAGAEAIWPRKVCRQEKARYIERAESMFGDMEETDVNLRENPRHGKP